MSSLQSNPLVSICIPVYNDEVNIKYAIESIINQTYQNWELIITDDCSKDGTLQVIKSYTDPRIIVIENEKNIGLSGNWNAVVKHAKGEYVKLLPSDDLIAPDCIEKQLEIFLSGKFPSVALVTCNRKIIDDNGDQIMIRKLPFNRHGLIRSRKAMLMNLLYGANQIGEPGAGLCKRNVFAQVGYYDTTNNYMIDVDFWLRVLLTGDLYVIPELLASFRITNTKDSCTNVSYKQYAKLWRKFAKKFHEDNRFKINNLQYYVCYVNVYIVQVLKTVVMKYYLK